MHRAFLAIVSVGMILGVIFLAGAIESLCGARQSASPQPSPPFAVSRELEQQVRQFVQHLQDGDCPAAYAEMTHDFQNNINLAEFQGLIKGYAVFPRRELKYTWSMLAVGDAESEKADVTLRFMDEDPWVEFRLELVRQKGEWKVNRFRK
jgi:hypothetical protein